MKSMLAAFALAALVSPAGAQDVSVDHAHHASEKAAARLSLNTPIEVIVADEAGKAVLDKDVPGLTSHEHYPAFKQMSLKQVASFAPDRLTEEVLARTEADLAAIQ